MEEIKRIDSPSARRFELHYNNVKASSLILFDYEFTYNTAVLRMGGIAGVQTAKEFRNQGFASKLMKATIDWMAQEQYDCSFLYGIPDFYWRYGYATVLTHGSTRVLVRSGELAPKGEFRVREMRKSDIPAIRQLYNENSRHRMCSIIRTEHWKGFPRGSDWDRTAECLVVESPTGSLEGYVVYDSDTEEFIVVEVETRDPRAQYAILHSLCQIGIARREKEFEYVGPTSHPFAVFCRRFGSTHSDEVERYGFGMGRLIHITTFFGSIAPELSRRSWLLPEGPSQVITFVTDIGECSLEVRKGSVRVVSPPPDTPRVTIACSQMELTRLVFGVVDYDTFSVSDGTTISGDGKLLGTLFPTQLNTIPPTLWF